ncbi:cupredoxin domain-containing protein [Paenibacillus phoenicis]|uniref:Cupredoxin domain-containing protein n=3 Tax=Paenibacillus TaxID=44249 RepID=A0ABW3S9C3_9BACL|nr:MULTISPECIES: cupredoxin domain-containing protein [Paenibacillus]MCH1638834.1 cupredoxin domain-containing protein [Paenibacillus timonensis]MEA3570689.1 cupredoxin domain-containing protein [Paenibacillus phoenicis]
MSIYQWGGTLLILLFIVGSIGFLFRKKKKHHIILSPSGYQEVKIRVNGKYMPNTIVVQRGKPVRMEFIREEKTAYSELVMFPHYHKSIVLPYGQKAIVELFPNEAGSYRFTSQMGRYQGTMVVRDTTEKYK